MFGPSLPLIMCIALAGTVAPLGFEVTKLIIDDLATFPLDLTMHVGDLSYAGIATNVKFLNITSGGCSSVLFTLALRSAPRSMTASGWGAGRGGGKGVVCGGRTCWVGECLMFSVKRPLWHSPRLCGKW